MTKKSALITGVSGQDGSYLTEQLLEKDYEIVGLIQKGLKSIPDYFQKLKTRITVEEGQLEDEELFPKLISKYKPKEIYNLASISSIKQSWENPLLTTAVNAVGPQRIYEAVRLYIPECKVFQASSSEIFGKVAISPQDESTPLNPNNPYGYAKAYAHQLARMYREKYQLFICCGVLYNHESPRRPLNFVTSKIAYGAACAKLGIKNSKDLNEEGESIVKNGKIALGNLEAKRDWSFAGVITQAMWLMLQQKTSSDYVLGSGQLHSIAEFCEAAFSYVGLEYKKYVTVDPRFVRPVEKVPMLADPSKAKRELKWKAKVGFEDLVKMMVNSNLTRDLGKVYDPNGYVLD